MNKVLFCWNVVMKVIEMYCYKFLQLFKLKCINFMISVINAIMILQLITLHYIATMQGIITANQ